jgi:hypothetical protein
VCRSAAAGPPDDVSVKEVKNLSLERCLQQPPAEIATRCPAVAGRMLELDRAKVALVDRVDQRKGTFLCDENGGSWRCRRIVVVDRELRGARKRNPQAFVTIAELFKELATASSVKLGEELGALLAPGLPPRTCLDVAAHGCATQAVRLRGRAPDKSGAPMVRRRLWVVEDGDGTTLACSDAALTRCDELTAAGWSAIAMTLRPSSLAPPEPAPELDLPEVRSDKRPGEPQVVGGAETGETPAGALDAWIRPKAAVALPKSPSKTDVQKTGHALELALRPCVQKGAPAATVEVIFSGEGSLTSLVAEGAQPSDPLVACLTSAARKLAFPRFAGGTYHLRAVVLAGGPEPARGRKRQH